MHKAGHREPQAVELRYGRQEEWTREGERTQGFPLSVAIDGNCARKKAERMFVRAKRALEKANLGGTAVPCYRPEIRFTPCFGFIFYAGGKICKIKNEFSDGVLP